MQFGAQNRQAKTVGLRIKIPETARLEITVHRGGRGSCRNLRLEKTVWASLPTITKSTDTAMFLTNTAKTSSWLRGSDLRTQYSLHAKKEDIANDSSPYSEVEA
jgi:hypothetical protein